MRFCRDKFAEVLNPNTPTLTLTLILTLILNSDHFLGSRRRDRDTRRRAV